MLACYRGPPHHKLELHVMQSFFTVLSMWFAMLHCNVGYAGLVKGLVEFYSPVWLSVEKGEVLSVGYEVQSLVTKQSKSQL